MTISLILATSSTSCSTVEDASIAQQEVPKFHELLEAGKFEAIYDASADDLKKVTTREAFIAFLSAVHRKLGPIKSTSSQNWNVNYHTSGTFVTLHYATTFAEDAASEEFVYRLAGGKALLAGYHINSNALILK